MWLSPSWRLGVLLLCVLVALTGCSSKNITSKGPFVLQEPSKGYPSVPSSSGQKTGTVYLPSDDGRPLTKAEQEAFLSEGEIDRNLPQEELGDVLLHFKYLVHKDRYTVEKNLERAQLYMPFIYETLRSRGLPRELAYVAFIESGYNPMATSSSGAAGMWQFISSTGKHYGMEQDWWMDERRDPYQIHAGGGGLSRQSFIRCSTTGIWRLRPTTRGNGKDPARARRYRRQDVLRVAPQERADLTVSGIACPMRTSSISPSFWLSAK